MTAPEFNLQWGALAALRLVCRLGVDGKRILDIGSGDGEHARFFRYFGADVTTIDKHKPADINGDFFSYNGKRCFDIVWASHVLEHQRNPGLFLDKTWDIVDEYGLVVITVPAHPAESIIDGHVSYWTLNLLMYHMALAGFNCSHASGFCVRGAEISIFAEPENRMPEAESIEDVSCYLPFKKPGGKWPANSFMNWQDGLSYTLPKPAIVASKTWRTSLSVKIREEAA